MGPPGRGRPASKIRLATLPSSPLESLSSVFGKEEQTELFAYNDLADAGRTTPSGRRAAKAILPHFVQCIALLVVAVTVAVVLLDHGLPGAWASGQRLFEASPTIERSVSRL